MGLKFFAKNVILTAGTFLGGLIHVGLENYNAGRAGDPSSTKLAAKLDNSKFIDNAPSAIVEKEKKKLDESQQTLFQLKRKHDAISDMS